MIKTDDQLVCSTGGVKELLVLFFPILVISFSSCFLLFVEQIFFARLSTQSMEAALNVAYVSRIFEGSSMALVMMAQVFVARWHGAQDFKAIGSGIWQFIWFSVLSMLITFPGNVIYGMFYFKETPLYTIALPYLYGIAGIGFLFPLGAALSCFYLGRGKTKLVVCVTLGSQFLNLALDSILIFGWQGWIPPLGLMGKIISTLIAQGGLCLLLFGIFLNSTNRKAYESSLWHFNPKLFWECTHPGFLRALGRFLAFLSWAFTTHLMVVKGADYTLVLSIGGTLFLFASFFSDALCQGLATVVSHILGTKNYHFLGKAYRSGSYVAFGAMVVLGLPFLLFPSLFFHLLFPNIAMDISTVRKIFFGVWLSVGLFTYGYVPISYILAFKDTKFVFFMGGMLWVHCYLLIYLSLEIFGMAADLFWIVLSFTHLATFTLYFLRMKWLNSQLVSPERHSLN